MSGGDGVCVLDRVILTLFLPDTPRFLVTCQKLQVTGSWLAGEEGWQTTYTGPEERNRGENPTGVTQQMMSRKTGFALCLVIYTLGDQRLNTFFVFYLYLVFFLNVFY